MIRPKATSSAALAAPSPVNVPNVGRAFTAVLTTRQKKKRADALGVRARLLT